MIREDGLKQIDDAEWHPDSDGCLNLFVQDSENRDVHAWLQLRPHYCDRGHLSLNIDMRDRSVRDDNLDEADGFPRYFFSFEEADRHTRLFLKWRLWKRREVLYSDLKDVFANPRNEKVA
jgi:hypothetical protein